MDIQIINFENITSALYYSQKFGISLPENRNGYLGLLFIHSDITYFSPIVRNLVYTSDEDFIVFGKIDELLEFVFSLGNEYPDVSKIAQATIFNYQNFNRFNFIVNDYSFPFSVPLIMGILNVTPDSFSDGGKFFDREQAFEHALEMINDGADIIDIGGESTRPGAQSVPVEEELDRVIPVIRKISRMEKGILISVDTSKAVVAEEAIKAGAHIVNDISAFSFDREILNVVRKYDVPYVLMHIKGTPETMQSSPYYEEPVAEIYRFLSERLDYLATLGITNVIVDPGIGFGKRVADNYEILQRIDEFKGLGLPILTGLSRKSFLGKSLNLDVDERANSTIVAETIAAMKGATIIRTHDVKNAVEMKKILLFSQDSRLAEKYV
jgi:dihydropteroate synthase